MTRVLAAAAAIIALVASASTASANSPPAPLKAKAKVKVCVGGQKYSGKRCGGPKKNIPSYCLDGKRVAGGYLIKNGGCYQNNGGGE